MEKQQPVPGQVPDNQLPPYSSLPGSQFQAYNPVPPFTTDSPYPTQIQTNQDAAVYNPMSQVTMNDGQPFPQLGFNTTYAPTTYDPMTNLPPVNLESTPTYTVIAPVQPASSARRPKRCCCWTIFSVISTILLILGAGLKHAVKEQNRKHQIETIKIYQDTAHRKFVDSLNRQNHPNWQNNNRYRRMVDVQGIDDFKDYDFIDFNDQPLFDEPFKSEKSSRRRRDLKMKNKFDKKITKHGTKKEKYYKAKKFIKYN